MAEYLLPSLGADMEAATLTEWFVKPGDTVHRGSVVAAVETAKGIIDIEIFAEGVIERLLAEPGAEVPVGAPLATYRPSGATAPEDISGPPAPPPAARVAPTAPTSTKIASGTERRLVSPAARKRAAELGVDLAGLPPSGAGGAVTLQDVERAAERRAAPAAAAAADMQAVIGRAMSRAKREIPHYYLATTIDMTRAQRFVAEWNAAHAVTERLLPGVLLLKAVALALRRSPELNGFWRDERFEPSAAMNVGVAIRLRGGGLVAPAVPDTAELGLPALMHAFQDLVQRARTGGLRSSELAGGSITVSSLGEGGVETMYPIIYPPQVAIVGFGGIAMRAWCRADRVEPAPVVTATLSGDHRVSDGHRGSRFLTEVAERLQRPEDL